MLGVALLVPLCSAFSVPGSGRVGSIVAGRNGRTNAGLRPSSLSVSPHLRQHAKFVRPSAATRMSAVGEEEGRLELTLGELCKTLVSVCTSGTLCTTLPVFEDAQGSVLERFGPESQATVEKWERDGKEYPFGTLVTYLLNEKGEPYMLLANNAAHTRNVLNNAKVALYVQNPKSPGQKGARVTLVGEIQKITSPVELKDCKEFYADRFPEQAQPLEDERFERFFSMYKILLKDIYYVSGFGVTTCWVKPEEFSKAAADPLAAFSQQLVDEWNDSRQDDYQSLAQAFFGEDLNVEQVDSPRITFLDRFGFDFRFRFPRKDQAKPKSDSDKQTLDIREYRVGFRQQAMSREEVQSSMFKMLQEAWEKNNGFEDEDWGETQVPPFILKRATDKKIEDPVAAGRPTTVG